MKKRTVQNGFLFIITIVLPAILLTCCKPQDKGYTRGIGVYPGNPDEDFSPDLCVDNTTYRNLALLRPAYHSSSYDYNLTAQLVTDGVITGDKPGFISLSTNRGTIPKNERVISDNFYWRGLEAGNYQALNDLSTIVIESKTTVRRNGDKWTMETRLNNTTAHPALMIRLKIAGAETGERILPALYSDNYISLMPGESKTITMSVKEEDARGEKPVVEISGFNLMD